MWLLPNEQDAGDGGAVAVEDVGDLLGLLPLLVVELARHRDLRYRHVRAGVLALVRHGCDVRMGVCGGGCSVRVAACVAFEDANKLLRIFPTVGKGR